MKDQVFTRALGEWQAVLNGKVLPHVWNSRGAALAGLTTERRRATAPSSPSSSQTRS